MLKPTVFTSEKDKAREAQQVHSVNGRHSPADLMRAVIKMNPEFHRLDGVLTGLAEACLNPMTRDAVQIVGVCSAAKGEGKTTVSLGLATALARRGDSEILLIEGDLNSPTLAEDLHQPPVEGLAECLRVEETLEPAIQQTPVEHLWIMTAGQTKPDDPFALFAGNRLRQLLRALRSRFRYIVLDMPAILEHEEAGRLVELVDGVILIIEAGKSSREVTESGVAAIGKDKLMGVVLNRTRSTAPGWVSRIFSVDERSVSA